MIKTRLTIKITGNVKPKNARGQKVLGLIQVEMTAKTRETAASILKKNVIFFN